MLSRIPAEHHYSRFYISQQHVPLELKSFKTKAVSFTAVLILALENILSELRHGSSIFLLKSEGGSLSLNALDIDK